LPIEPAAFQVPERAATVSLQPLLAATVELVPVALAEGEAPAGNGPLGTPAPNSVAATGKGQIPATGSGADPGTPAEAALPATAPAQPAEDSAVQRFVLGVDEAAAPAIGPDGDTARGPAGALGPEMPARSDPVPVPSDALPLPVVRSPAAEAEEAEAPPVSDRTHRAALLEPADGLLGTMVLVAAAWCLPWQGRRERKGEQSV
jgi:hypothetical protein